MRDSIPGDGRMPEQDGLQPAAMALPREGQKEEAGRYGPIFPKTPANYGFTLIAKIKPGTEQEIRDYGKTLEKAVAATPDVLAPLQLHCLRWVLFDIGSEKYFMYQGIFDTDFDKYTEDAVALFNSTGITTIFTKLEGFRTIGRPACLRQVRSRPPESELSRIRRISIRIVSRSEERVAHEAGIHRHARRITVATAYSRARAATAG